MMSILPPTTGLKILLLMSMVTFFANSGISQTDSLTLKNNNYIIGEIKSMERGILVIETEYSDADFTIKWEEIQGLFSKTPILITSKDRGRLYGTITSPEPRKLTIATIFGDITLDFEEVLYIKPVDKGFFDRLNASIDLGFTMTKERNQRQFSLRSRVEYIAEKWSLDGNFNTLTTRQDEIDNISRSDGGTTYTYVLPKQWIALARLDFLSNTEQQLKLRTNYKLGGGKYLVRSNYMYISAFMGVSFNNEDFEMETDDRKSMEYWVGSEINMFNTGDLSLQSNIFVYPSLTEKGRLRTDYKIDFKYDLPLDFYVKTGLTLNFDNQPAESAGTVDYIWQSSFGWSW